MRTKIIAVNAGIVALVGLLSFLLVRASLTAVAVNTPQLMSDAKHDALGASARLQLDGLRMERWLSSKASSPSTLDVLSKASPRARGDAATGLCDSILSEARGAAAFEGGVPSLIVLVDSTGKILGRNGSDLLRGEDLAAIYPSLKDALTTGHTGTDVWVKPERNDQYLASFAPVRSETGRLLGAVIAGVTLNDELSRVSDATTGRPVKLVAATGDTLQIVAHSAGASDALVDAINKSGKDSIKNTLASRNATAFQYGDVIVAAAPLNGVGDGRRVALVAAAPAALIENVNSLLLPILGVAALGLLLVVIGGWLLGAYITRPINMLEEGLLAILNGQTDKRFELDHPELGGLAFRIDQLLNQLMGIEEDTTDEEGRVSKAPTAADFSDAMSVDEKRGAEPGLDPALAQKLASEPAQQYYGRLFREYIAAKKAIGEPTDHITEATFVDRIRSMEQEAAAKQGRPVRYEVQARGHEVTLLAVPIG